MHRKKNADANNMTAVCIKCGNFKNKAIIPCSFCGFSPESDEEMARIAGGSNSLVVCTYLCIIISFCFA